MPLVISRLQSADGVIVPNFTNIFSLLSIIKESFFRITSWLFWINL